ncbi:MAG: hypothetical protein AAB113_06990, partial [Candidatus Eisenbacteria bacterium]
VEAHEGRIWAENRDEGGARFVFELPIEGPTAAREPRAGTEACDAGAPARPAFDPNALSAPGPERRVAA